MKFQEEEDSSSVENSLETCIDRRRLHGYEHDRNGFALALFRSHVYPLLEMYSEYSCAGKYSYCKDISVVCFY